MRAFARQAVLCSLVPLLNACWVPLETGQAMQRDIRRIREQGEERQKQVDAQDAELTERLARIDKELGHKVEEIDAKLADLNRGARRTDAGFGVRLDEQQRELQELRGQNELLQYRIAQLEKQLGEPGAAVVGSTGVPAAAAPPGASAPAASAPAALEGASKPAEPDPNVPTDKEGLLAYGKKLAAKNELEQARGVFRELVRKYPKEAGFADSGYYQIGESYFNEKKYRPALQEYIHVVEKFGQGSYADDAYYRIGLCSMELGNLEDALVFFNEIVEHHKDSPLVKAAKKKHGEVKARLDKEKKG